MGPVGSHSCFSLSVMAERNHEFVIDARSLRAPEQLSEQVVAVLPFFGADGRPAVGPSLCRDAGAASSSAGSKVVPPLIASLSDFALPARFFFSAETCFDWLVG